ncbi:MAG: HI0074 family nucleotidyltransferase substrate-binding subunit [Methylacidiphilaceae bacterium]|nr:HI0074 family nucleotidyltransferase substrate-binding subunit [Candidatus Methylacidiphilaceae bacterium]
MIAIEPLEKAVARLEEGLERYRAESTDLQLRDGLIQRFEFTYEIAHKTLRRFLAETAPNPAEVQGMAFAELIRTANQQELLRGDWALWRTFREMRAKTSHTYGEEAAHAVVVAIPDFLGEVEHLLGQLKRRLR